MSNKIHVLLNFFSFFFIFLLTSRNIATALTFTKNFNMFENLEYQFKPIVSLESIMFNFKSDPLNQITFYQT